MSISGAGAEVTGGTLAPLQSDTIGGIVLDEQGEPVAGVYLTFDGGNATVSDDSGRFTALLPEGNYTVMAERAGYADTVLYNVSTGSDVTVHITPDGWFESGDEFADGHLENVQIQRGTLRLAIDQNPLLPPDEWFFVVGNDYMSGGSWIQRSDNRGRVWYIDINGDGTFSNKGASHYEYDEWEVAVDGYTLNSRGIPMADFDNDGDYDLVIPRIWYDGTWHDENNLAFVENQGVDAEGHRVFADPVSIPGTGFEMSAYLMDAAVEDFDCDGNWDFAITGNRDDLLLFMGQGDGTFDVSTITVDAPGSRGRGKDAGDINNDGNPDIVYTEYSTGGVYAFYGRGNGTFSAPQFLFKAFSERYDEIDYRDPYGLAVGDFDNDGTADIITNDGRYALYSLWKGDGTGNFTRMDTILDLSSYGAIDDFDIDGDGDLDLLVIENVWGGRIYAAINQQDGGYWSTMQIIRYSSALHRSTFAISTPPGASRYHTSGTYVSHIHDTGDDASRITLVDYDAHVNANQSLTVQVRTSSDPAMVNASAWVTVESHDNTIPAPAGRYVQYRVLLSSTSLSTPVLDSIMIKYVPDPVWLTGVVNNTGGYPVGGVRVSLRHGGAEFSYDITDSNGSYCIGVRAGDYRLVAEVTDYNHHTEGISLTANTTHAVTIRFRNYLRHTDPEDFTGDHNGTKVSVTRRAVTLANDLADHRPVISNYGDWTDWKLQHITDERPERVFHATRNAGESTGYRNPQWVAIDLGEITNITTIDYYMSYSASFWQNGFTITVYTDYNTTTKEFSGGTVIARYPQWTWTTASDCPDRLVLRDGATFTASNGSTVSGWLPSTPVVRGRYVRVHDVYGNYTNSDRWHYYRISDIRVYGPSMQGTYISPIWNTTDPDNRISAIQWYADRPAGTALRMEIRTGDTEAELLSSNWTRVSNMEHDPGLSGQFIQYRVNMSTSDGYYTPVLRDITIHYNERPAWIRGLVTQVDVGTLIPMARIHVTSLSTCLDNFTVLTHVTGEYVAPVEYPESGTLNYTVTVEKYGYATWTTTVLISSAQRDQVRPVEMTPKDDWTQVQGNAERTSHTALTSNFVTPGVKWRYHTGGFSTWGVIADVNKDTRNDILMVYGDRVVAKTPDDVLLWIGNTSAVDRIIGVYDLDKNGIPEVIAANYYPARISIINGINGSLEYEQTWATRYLHYTAPDCLVVDDFDGSMDGRYEMLVKLNDGKLRAWTFRTVGWRAEPQVLWERSFTYDFWNAIAVGDVDLDGVKEVVVLSAHKVAVYNAEDGSLEQEESFSGTVTGSLVIMDLDPDDGRGNIIIPYRAGGVYVLECNTTALGVRSHYEVDPVWGSRLYFFWRDGCIADVDGDGTYELVAQLRFIGEEAVSTGHNHWHSLVIDLDRGEVEARFGSPATYSWETRAVADIDGDARPEIILQSGSRWVAIQGNRTAYWEKWNVSGYGYAIRDRRYRATHDPTACWQRAYSANAFGDVDGDGINDLLLSRSTLRNVGAYRASEDGLSDLDEIWFFPTRLGDPTPRMYVRDIGNLTGNGTSEVVLATDDGYVYSVNVTGAYETALTGGPTSHLWAADMDGNGLQDVLFHLPNTRYLAVINLTGADYHNDPVLPEDAYIYMTTDDVHILDYDDDDRLEVISRSWSTIYVFEWDGTQWTLEWRFNRYDIFDGNEKIAAFSNIAIGDYNGDEYLDIFFTYRNYSYSPPHLWTDNVPGSMVLDGRTHMPIWIRDGIFCYRPFLPYDLDGDGLDELVTVDGRTFRSLDPLAGEWILQAPCGPTYSYGGQMLGTADTDAMSEVLVGYQFYSSNIIGSAVDVETGESIWWGGDREASTYRQEAGRGASGDVDGDGIDEVVQTMLDGRAYCIDDDGTVLWRYDMTSTDIVLTSPTIADLDYDGTPEVLFGASDGYLYVLNGNNGTRDWRFYFGFGMEQPIVADVDADGLGEILVSVHDGYIYCLDNIDYSELTIREQDVKSVVNQPDGNYVTIEVDVRNEGGTRAEDVLVRFTDNGVVFEEVTVDIAAGQKRHIEVTWFAHPVGNHTINISVDPEDEIHEMDETNNHFLRTIYVWPVPDMAISPKTRWEMNPDVSFGIGPVLGTENRIDITVHNLGPVLAENFRINLTDNDRPVDSILVTLGAYENGTYSLYWTPRRSGKNLTHTLEIWIDRENRIVEFSEENNHAILTAVQFGPPPEIELRREDIEVIGGIEMPEEDQIGVIEGDTLVLNCTLRNRGFLAAAYVGVLVFIDVNRDLIFTPEDDVYIHIEGPYTAQDKWSKVVEIIPSPEVNLTEPNEQPMRLDIDTVALRAALYEKTGSDSLRAYPLVVKVDPRDLIYEEDNYNTVIIGDLLIIPTMPEVAVSADEIYTDFDGESLERSEIRVWVRVRNYGATEAPNVTVVLSDNGEIVGTQVVDVPAVTRRSAYDEAWAVASFSFRTTHAGEHAIHVQIVYNGEEALTFQDNNDAERVLEAVEVSGTTAGGLSPSILGMVMAALVVALWGWTGDLGRREPGRGRGSAPADGERRR